MSPKPPAEWHTARTDYMDLSASGTDSPKWRKRSGRDIAPVG